MIAGTSTGGIIALGLAHGLTAREIQKFYVERGDLVFPPANAFGRMWRSQVRVLNLGCGETSFRVDPARAVGGLIQWRALPTTRKCSFAQIVW